MKKNVLHIGTSGGRGGIESFILNMCSRLDKSKYHFTIIADCDKAIIEQDFKDLGGDVHYIPAITKDKKGYVKALWHAIDKNKYDIVHIHKNSLSNPFPILICKLKGIKSVILHSHNSSFANPSASQLVHSVFKRIINLFSLERLACSALAGEWMFGKSKKFKFMRNGINIERYRFNPEIRQRIRAEFEIEADAYAICNVGRLCEQKNTLFLLKIFDEICKKRADARLYLIGKGPLEEEAKAYAAASPNAGKIFFLGIRPNVNEILQGMDLFLMPSLYEGLPIAAVEAQASGLPLLISDTVDSGIKICDTTEIETLGSSAEIWAAHVIDLAQRVQRADHSEAIISAGYDVDNSAKMLDEIYQNM